MTITEGIRMTNLSIISSLAVAMLLMTLWDIRDYKRILSHSDWFGYSKVGLGILMVDLSLLVLLLLSITLYL